MSVDAFERLQRDMGWELDEKPLELPKPAVRHCTCSTDVVGAWDNKARRYRWFVPTPRRGQFIIRQKPLPGWGTPWQATWWGPTGGEYSVHECSGRVPDEVRSFGSIDSDGGWEAETYGGVA